MKKVVIVSYEPKYKKYFYEINKEWVSSMFEMEEIDETVLSDPDTHILKPGGNIWFAITDEGEVIGTCALKKSAEGEFELTKMGVTSKARGLKVGEKLLQHVINFSKEANHKLLYLLTNSKCEAAIHLYLKNGFEHSEEIKNSYGQLYCRCDVAMKYIDNE